ncbi:MAG: hypothetical protein COW04_07405 [Deltaproteobacteria bacterium CG12_big_fil_rev_8_21_14_0_65_43_10]|nr:MAG: hypothetical protein AUK23_02750 [Deltaproteobacteria bacterium CG2_30_43_15]PIQ45489.1 MAG: hypothetical protein COW04_07405 [Deltaproteobacteria bacterium CG12_big_fil_rev_8_21_14_0_65_43_10]PIU85473.1 MAG: hypothetical protein COS67_07675 [Deltaproteobacteria bacterium CG06_land_8_20_14_3_00_44_19]PIX23681.1 MAG: hypothetical protein COZ68_08640 [Deltaproteobacteria bacterium CG_4_8_14_3_um_filter_43_13]PIZ19807.1 MAG: hypothetical protein COY50_08100 [Deltaproteobacteria bacterium C
MRYRGVQILLICLMAVFLCTVSFAAEIGTYQIVPGKDDNAYLVNTMTGAVWVLTYRTLPTGREPVAIPYKFIKFSPQNYKSFLIEDIPGAFIKLSPHNYKEFLSDDAPPTPGKVKERVDDGK